MDGKGRMSQAARTFVERKLEQYRTEASKGCGLHYELYAQNFTDSVNRLAAMTKRPELREHILSEAGQSGDYVAGGRWAYDVENNDVHWRPNASESPAAKYGAPADNRHDRSLAQGRAR